jgi:hypothetical protein
MPRHNGNSRVIHYNHMSFRKMCRMAGIDPIQRIKLVRLIKKEVDNQKIESNK